MSSADRTRPAAAQLTMRFVGLIGVAAEVEWMA
jgi:hypothetical protein